MRGERYTKWTTAAFLWFLCISVYYNNAKKKKIHFASMLNQKQNLDYNNALLLLNAVGGVLAL